MLPSLPTTAQEFKDWTWPQIQPYFDELAARTFDAATVDDWLAGWSQLARLLSERYSRLYVGITCDTTDPQIQAEYQDFVENIFPQAQAAEQRLKELLLESGLRPAGFEVPLHNMQAEADLFRESNLPLLSEELKLSTEYDRIIGAQTVDWDGQELTISQLRPVYQEQDRSRREGAWRLAAQRQLEDRQAINNLWVRFLKLRHQMALNAGLPDYRAYRWQQLLRFDYTPEDCLRFHAAIEQVVVPAVEKLNEARRQRLGLSRLRPWDLEVDPHGRPPLRPFDTLPELEAGIEAMFRRVDPPLAGYFHTMRSERLLDLENRKGKAPGGYCTEFAVAHRPFIFMNSVGLHDDVQTLLHEGGHAFHVFETAALPYYQQLQVGMEFGEVASMGMELLAAPYLEKGEGAFYTPQQAARARSEHLEEIIRFWPYMAVVDAFQHWVYTHPEAAAVPANCDAAWADLWARFMTGVDWSGLEAELETGWHRKLHIHQVPFYYVEYGLAQLGAVQVWRNSLSNPAAAVAAYRKALALGGTAPLPGLYAAAGARFAFDAETVQSAVDLVMKTLGELEQKL